MMNTAWQCPAGPIQLHPVSGVMQVQYRAFAPLWAFWSLMCLKGDDSEDKSVTSNTQQHPLPHLAVLARRIKPDSGFGGLIGSADFQPADPVPRNFWTEKKAENPVYSGNPPVLLPWI